MKFNDLSVLIQNSLQDNIYKQCQIYPAGGKDIGDGYLSDIYFVNVRYKANGEQEKILYLAIKKSKECEAIKEAFNLRNIFKQEVLFYSTIFPTFLKFQHDRQISNIFNPLAKCYKVILSETTEMIILENLRGNGFELCDRSKPLSLKNLKLALENYGKLHALSFALRDQDPMLFESLTRKLSDVFRIHINGVMYPKMPIYYDQVLQLLLKRGERGLFEQLDNLLKKGYLLDKILDLTAENTGYSIVNHGDGWINNLMFKYKDKTKTNPCELAIIDWQLVTAHNSPIYDLSFLLYICASIEDLKNLNELLEFYYDSLSNFTKQLGSDPQKLFPYDTFMSHWKRYSIFGFALVPLMMKLMYCKQEDIKTEGATNSDEYCNWMEEANLDDTEYEDRVIGLCRRFFHNIQ